MHHLPGLLLQAGGHLRVCKNHTRLFGREDVSNLQFHFYVPDQPHMYTYIKPCPLFLWTLFDFGHNGTLQILAMLHDM